MKTFFTVILAVIGTAIALSSFTRGRAAVTPAEPVGRYAISAGGTGGVWMLDTATGTAWQFTYRSYCKGRTPPYGVSQLRPNERCADTEVGYTVPTFARAAVEGLNETPLMDEMEQGKPPTARAGMGAGSR